MSKSPINILGAIAGGLIAGRGKKKTARQLKKMNKKLDLIVSKVDTMSGEGNGALVGAAGAEEISDQDAAFSNEPGIGNAISAVTGNQDPTQNAMVDPTEVQESAMGDDNTIDNGSSVLSMLKKYKGRYKSKKQ
jgi:hypothetical protein|tara:strand:- start:308 stop:709 length:402 start_codon:yes stop_codon:yes gene_type:complete